MRSVRNNRSRHQKQILRARETAKNRGEPRKMTHCSEFFFGGGMVQMGKVEAPGILVICPVDEKLTFCPKYPIFWIKKTLFCP